MTNAGSFVRRLFHRLPEALQAEVRARRFRRHLRAGRLSADEPEFDLLDRWVGRGDVAIDIGANYGIYTARLSALVGPDGLVIAVEPLPRTFRFLVANSRHFPHPNVALLNAAISDHGSLATMTVPQLDEAGFPDVYFARLAATGEPGPRALTLPLDALVPERRVALVKIDAEGHEPTILEGMRSLLRRDRPVLVIEDSSPRIGEVLAAEGYAGRQLPGSPNRVYEPA